MMISRYLGKAGWWVALAAASLCFALRGTSEVPFSPTDREHSRQRATISIELVDTSTSWMFPLWGYHSPKVVQNSRGEIWAINFFGQYPAAKAQVLKRTIEGKWMRGHVFDDVHQPAMLFLDASGRINVIHNVYKGEIRHFRSVDDNNLQEFRLVCRGNGQAVGEGSYAGVGVHGNRVFLSYITSEHYDLFLTSKDVQDSNWTRPVVIARGKPSTGHGNHAFTRPKFAFGEKHGYMLFSEVSDGGGGTSYGDTYHAVHLVRFSLDNPQDFTSERVNGVPPGFWSMGYDIILGEGERVICSYDVKKRIFQGENRETDSITTTWRAKKEQTIEGGGSFQVEEGSFVAMRQPGAIAWKRWRVFDSPGVLSLFREDSGAIMALSLRPKPRPCWFLSRYDVQRDTWTSELIDSSGITHLVDPSHLQLTSHSSGSLQSAMHVGLFNDTIERMADPGRGRQPEKDILKRYRLYLVKVGQ